MDMLIVYFYDHYADRWQYSGIVNNEEVCYGFIERAVGSRDMGIATVSGICQIKGTKIFKGGQYDYKYDEFWANCESYNQALMCKLIKELYSSFLFVDDITILNIINLN